MADVKKKNTVTLEKQDGTKKEVATKNVPTSSANTETKKEDTSLSSKIKDKLTNAYTSVKENSPIKSGNMEFLNGGGMDYVNYVPNEERGMDAWARKIYGNGEPNSYVLGKTVPNDMNGYTDTEYKTPLGTFNYGQEGDAIYGSYTSPITRGREIYPSEEGYTDYARLGNNEVGRYVDDSRGTTGHYLDVNGRNLGETYRADWTGIGDNGQLEDNSAYGIAVNTPLSGNYYNEINLPMGGMIGYGNNNGRLSADYTPANGSLQARILDALTRRRR